MGKTGTIWQFFRALFLALGGHCLQMLCLQGFGTHANTQNLPHFRAFPASIQEHSPPQSLFFMANAKLPNRPGFALLQLASSESKWIPPRSTSAPSPAHEPATVEALGYPLRPETVSPFLQWKERETDTLHCTALHVRLVALLH